MKKKIIAFSLMMILLLGSSISVFAEDRQGASGWQVTFDGKKLESNFTSANMDDEIYNMEPGDSVELTITLKNTYDGQADWYMKNQVLETLEDAGNISGGAYDYLLTYTDAAGETSTLYSSEKFGGEGRYNGVGLHGATVTLDEYFYLDRLGNGDTGVVKLKVALDGPSQDNAYQNTLAKLQMSFATELVKSGSGSGTPSGGGQSSSSGARTVKTGDQTNSMLFILLTLGAGLVILLIVMMRLRGNREEAVEVAGMAGMASDMDSDTGNRRNHRTGRGRRD